MSDKTLLTTAFSVQSVRLVTCLICLLLTFPLVDQIHEDHCGQTACTSCTLSLGCLLPVGEHFTVIIHKRAGIERNEAAISARQAFFRPYDSRGPPQIS
jgi:hypothetical protein